LLINFLLFFGLPLKVGIAQLRKLQLQHPAGAAASLGNHHCAQSRLFFVIGRLTLHGRGDERFGAISFMDAFSC
jgi:hypothetical protein